jgi:formylglycine-generating enzyme required for sulfatase activity
VLEEQRRLSFFLLSPPANFSLDVEGINGVITNGFTELQVRSLPRPNETIFVTTLPITNRQYRIFLGQTGYLQPPTWQRPNYCEDDAPVTGVNWFEAATFAAWIGGALLTEEEWIAAARGKERTRTFATATGLIDDAAAYFGNAFASGAPKLPISHPPNPEGFYGLCGNTWDWCATPKGPHRAILGGGYMDSATFCRIDAGYRNAPIDRDCCVGFRVKASVA